MSEVMIELQTGYIQLVHVQERHGSKIRMGGYAIHRNMDGTERFRTPTTWNCELECWTDREAKRLLKD